MKYIFTILFIAVRIYLPGQETETKSGKVVKTGQVFTNGKLSYYYENDRNGKRTFAKNDGMNGPVTMIFASEYDTLNREIRIFSAHSNIGFSLRETVYGLNRIEHYSYSPKGGEAGFFDRNLLNQIGSRKEFLELKAMNDLRAGEKRLTKIDILDSAENVTIEYYISEDGDTTSINTHRYNENNKEIFFHYGTINSEVWTWDIYYVYDSNLNLVQSFRVSANHGIKDTTETHNYIYNSENQLISENYYYKKSLSNRTDFSYTQENKIKEEHFYERDELKPDVITQYEYDNAGNLARKIKTDYRRPEGSNKEVFTYKLTYW